jgi:hypothetical protein
MASNERKDILHDLKQYRKALELEYKMDELRQRKENAKDVLFGSFIGMGFYGVGSLVTYLMNKEGLSTAMGVVFLGLSGISLCYGIKEAILENKEKNDEKELKLLYSEIEKWDL